MPIHRIRAYYHHFRSEYRLLRNASRTEAVFGAQQGGEKISLVLMANQAAAPFLQALSQQTLAPDEVVLVQQAPGVALQSPPGLSLTILDGQELSDGAARNLGIARARHPIILLMQADIVPEPDLFACLCGSIVGQKTVALSAPHLKPHSLEAWLDAPYRGEMASPLASWQALAFRKIEWARIGGIPEDIPAFAAWVIFLKRFFQQQVQYVHAEAEVEIPRMALLRRALSLGEQDGALGLAAGWYESQVRPAALALLVFSLGVFLLLLSPWLTVFPALLAWLTLAGIFALWPNPGVMGVRLGPNILSVARLFAYGRATLRRDWWLAQLNGQAGRHLKLILSAHPHSQAAIVYFPTHDWGGMFQRPHQMARHFAKQGYLFFYGTRNETNDAVAEFQPVEPNLYLVSMPAVPPETFRIAAPLILYIGAAWYAYLPALFERAQVIYDHYDDLAVSGASLADHQHLLQRADVVLASSRILLQAVSALRPDVLFVPNAVDDAWAASFRPQPGEAPPADLLPVLQSGAPLAGYSGALAQWFDYGLLRQVAQALPGWQFVLLGMDYDGTLQTSGLLSLPNVHWLGQKTYAELFHYVWRFDVALIPFVINEITLATSPIKLYEYFACEKPVVATALPEVLRHPEVFAAQTAQEFGSKIPQALSSAASPDYLQALRRVVQENTWSQRVQLVLSKIKLAS